MSDDYGPKLNTTVVVATSEAEAFPASSLERHTARTKGWHSAKMSEYPLDIVFSFDGLAEIQCVRLLSHESKIPAKVDLYVFTPSEDDIARGAYPPVETADFRRLGYINFSTNEASNFCARELKTVRVKARVQYLKLSIRGCHANGVNVFNQAGLVAADFHGTLLAPYPHTARQALLGSRSAMNPDSLDAEVALSDLTPVKAPSSATGTTRRRVEDQAGGAGALERQQSSSRPGTASMSNFDSITAQRIKQLMLFKAKAVAEEDYDLAKALKTQIDQLQAVGERIAELEEAKRVAVDQEDYDAAKVLKRQIDELRNPKPPAPPQPQAAAPAHYGATAAPSLAPIYAPAPYEHGEGAAPAHNTRTSPLYGNDDVPVGGGGGGGRAVPYDEQPAVARGRGNQMSEYPDEGPSGGAAAARSRSNPRDAHDEKLAVATGAADDETGGIVVGNKQPAAAGRTVPIEQEGMPAWERQFNLRIVALAGAEEGHAPPLEGSKLKEYQEFTTAFGLYGMSCLFAKKWQLRDAALRAIVDKEGFAALTSSQRSPSQGNPTSNLMVLLSYLDGKTTGVNDSIAQVFFTVCDVIKAIVGEDLPGVPVVAALSGLTNLLPAMLMKAGDSNQRVREKAQTTLLMLAMSPVGTERVANAALHDPQEKSKKPLNYRVHEARLAILRVLVSKVGVNTKAARTGLAPDVIVQRLCIPMLGHASGDVRDAAMQLIITLYEHVPNAQTMDALLKDIKPAQKVAIDELRGGGGGAKEPEIASSSIHVERGGNHPVLEAARQAKGEPAAAPAAAAKGGAAKDPSAAARQQQQRDEALREAQTCQFCGKYDPRFTDATLDAHYARTCPMLCPCPHCHQITEIPTLQQHLVAECNRSTAVKQCPTCREAVHAAEFDEHVAAASCIPCSTSYHVCPLCHVKLPPTDQGWDDHLLKAPGCVNNPRRYDGGSGEEFK